MWDYNQLKPTHPFPDVHCPSLDVLFVVDSSGSVQRVYEEQKRWLEEILCQIQLEEPEKGPQVALIQFAGAELQKTEWAWNRFSNSEQMMDAFHQVRHGEYLLARQTLTKSNQFGRFGI